MGPDDVAFNGGIDGVGVTTGHEQVYLVFWGSQWGSASTNGAGDKTFSGDPQGVAPDLQAFFEGLGTNGETWSGVATQYCQGVSTGAFSCPASNTAHVAYPTGGALAGVWEDTSSAAPSAASGHQLAQEAESAATHFGNTTTASNRDAQYVIVSPTGTDPDSYETQGFCAWHDYSGDATLDGGGVASGPTLAFTNLPYVPDAGSGCGQNYVNSGSAGTLDGVTIVEGHEYNETITDQYPAGGWTTPSGAAAGEEVGDLCAWINFGQGAAADVSLSTGSFAVQSIWANDYNGGQGACEISHPVVTDPSTVTVTSPGNQTSVVGTAVSLQIKATDSTIGQTLTYSASGLPAGLSINSSSGLVSGTPTTAGTSNVTVTAKDSTGASGSASFTWTVNPGVANKVTVSNPGNQTSVVGTSVSLQIQATDSASGQTLTYGASGLPAGLSINSSSGLISGTPTTAGTSNVTVTAKDSTGASGTASFTFTVNPASLTVKVSGSQTYGGSPSFTTSTSPPSGDSFSGALSCSSVNGGTAISPTLSAGSYTIDGPSCSGLSLTGPTAGDYTIVYEGSSFTVNPAPLTVKVSGSQTYGGSPSFTTSTSPPSGDSFSGALSCSSVNGGTAISPTLSAGSYTIDGPSCSGLSLTGPTAADYTIAYQGSPFTVNPAPLTVEVSGSQTYGGSPSFTTSTSPPSGDSFSGALSCSSVNGGTAISPTLSAGGSYTIDGSSCSGLSLTGSTASDYAIVYKGSSFTVNPAPLTVEVSGSQTYGGSPSFTTSTSPPSGDSFSGALSCSSVNGGTAISPTLSAGSYTIDGPSCSGLSLTGPTAADYTIVYEGSTFTVNPAPLTVNPPSASAEYGNVPSSFTPTYAGFVNGDSAASLSPQATCTTTATDTSPPGSYPITCSGASDPNYAISYGPAGTLTITKAPTNLAAAPARAGLFAITFSATLTRADNGAGISGRTVAFSFQGHNACQATTNSSGVASCTIHGLFIILGSASYTATFAGDDDYQPSSASGKVG